mgnify:CR=1 FL=1
MRLIDADELLNRLKGVAYTAHVKNVIHDIIEQSHTKQPTERQLVGFDEVYSVVWEHTYKNLSFID